MKSLHRFYPGFQIQKRNKNLSSTMLGLLKQGQAGFLLHSFAVYFGGQYRVWLHSVNQVGHNFQ